MSLTTPEECRLFTCNDIYSEGKSMIAPLFTTSHGLLFGTDCLEILGRMRSETIDCVFADPPFNIGKKYKNGFDDRRNADAYMTWCERWIVECCRVLAPGGAFFTYVLPELAIKFGHILDRWLDFRHWIAMSMKGSYPRGNRLYPAHYGLLYYTKGRPKTFNKIRIPVQTCRHCRKDIKNYGGQRKYLHPDGLNLSDFWEDTSPNRHKKHKVRPGVNELKIMIPERAIVIATNPGEIIFDPFGGGGSTYHAAELLKRNWLGTEMYDGKHIRQRFEQHFPVSLGKTPCFSCELLFT
jgi:site-specific DNA-methyltransferase (adenine-specific)